MASNSSQPHAWWERPRFCSEGSPPGCSYSFFTQLECVQEIGENGVPVKRCIQLRKRLLNCPGREPMVDEQKQEVTTYPGAPELPGNYNYPNLAGPQPQTAQSADMGQALQEVIKLAEDLQEGFKPSDSSSVHLDTPPQAAGAAPWVGSGSSRENETGLLSRLFKGRRTREPLPTKQRPQSPGGAPWRDYAKDFQDV